MGNGDPNWRGEERSGKKKGADLPSRNADFLDPRNPENSKWNNMPIKDASQPHMDDQTALYLRLASTEAESTIREALLDTLGMTKELRAEAQQVLFRYS